MIKLSVLIPVYNVAIFLHQCLDSIINQTLKDIEIICINDGSTDESLAILQNYAQRDRRIQIIDKPNTGYGHSMNIGLKAATGEYIGIVESDDFADTNMFEQLYLTAVEHDAEIVKSNYLEYKNGENHFVEFPDNVEYLKVISPSQYQNIFFWQATIWSAIYKKDFLLGNDIWFNETPGASYQDTAFTFKVLACAKHLVLLKEAFLHYRTDNTNSSVNSVNKVFCICDEYDEIQRFLEKNSILQERYKYLVEILKFRIYQWNYHRVSPDYKYEFLLRFTDEFHKAKKNGLLIQEHWADQEWLAVHKLMESPEQFHYKNYVQSFWQRIESFNYIVIYGAGVVGKNVAGYIKNKGLSITCFAVANLVGNASEIENIPVYCIDQMAKYKTKGVILVATKEADQPEIVRNLQQRGFDQIIPLDLELRKVISSSL